MKEFPHASDFVAAAAEGLAHERFNLSRDAALSAAKTLWPRLDHSPAGELMVRLENGLRVPADETALGKVTLELFATARAADLESAREDARAREARIAQQRRMYERL